MIRVFGLVASSLDPSKQEVFRHLLSDSDVTLVGVCIDSRPDIGSFAKVWRELRRGRGGYVGVQIAKAIAARWRNSAVDSEDFFTRHSVWTMHCDDLYVKETVEAIRNHEPDVLFRAGFGIIREPLLSLAPYGMLSYHHGDMRKYRGQPPAFWELYHGETEMHVTVQRLSSKLDAGVIIKEMSIPIYPDDTWRSLAKRAYSVSNRLALEAIRAMKGPVPVGETLAREELGPVFTAPNLRQWLTLQVRVARRVVTSRLRFRRRPAR
jgi:folate-dependent phosphoribosylglycinamide formyltransferase PurN